MLFVEFTLSENPAITTTSLLRAMCHADDSIILGTWLQETDHRNIEDQVRFFFLTFFLLSERNTETLFLFFSYLYFFFLYLLTKKNTCSDGTK